MSDPNIAPSVDAREVFRDTLDQLHRIRNFVVESTKPPEPPKTPEEIEDQLREIHTTVRRATPFDLPTITSESVNALKGVGEVQDIPDLEKLRALMQAIHYPDSEQQLFPSTGTFAMIDGSTGEIYFNEVKGNIHDLPEVTGDDGVARKLFRGGLPDYAFNKILVRAGLSATQREDGIGDQENNDWAVDVTNATMIHMGSAAHSVGGRTVYFGVSGAEMHPDAVAVLIDSLQPESTDGEFTCAGYMDEVVAGWGARIASGEEITVEQAQAEIDDAFALFHALEEVDGFLPPHYH